MSEAWCRAISGTPEEKLAKLVRARMKDPGATPGRLLRYRKPRH